MRDGWYGGYGKAPAYLESGGLSGSGESGGSFVGARAGEGGGGAEEPAGVRSNEAGDGDGGPGGWRRRLANEDMYTI